MIVEVRKLMLCEAERRAGGGDVNRAGRLVRQEVAAVVEVCMADAVRGGRAKGGWQQHHVRLSIAGRGP